MGEHRAPLAPHVRDAVTDHDIDETWQRLDGSLRPERRPWRAVVGVAAVAAVLVVGVVVTRPAANDESLLEAGATLSAGTVELSGRLREGSMVAVAPESSGAIEAASSNEVRVRLQRGAMRFDVAKNPGRRFSVVAGRVEVRVVGTRFVVRRDDVASVQVERGVVEVWRDGAQRAVLTAGQAWTEPVEAAVVVDAPEVEPSLEAPTPEERQVPSRKPTRRVKRTEQVEASAPLPPLPTTVVQVDEAAEAFKRAFDARRAGRAGDAAQALRTFLSRFPDDDRAGLAWFELGRLEMDQLRAPSSALESLSRAVARAPLAPYVEDAMARVVRLHHALKHEQACASAKAAYVKRFPDGLHAATLSALCTF